MTNNVATVIQAVSPLLGTGAAAGAAASAGAAAGQVVDKNFAVADFSGASSAFDRLDAALHDGIVNRSLDLYFGQEVDHVFGAPIQFGVPFLAAKAFDLGHGDALHPDG